MNSTVNQRACRYQVFKEHGIYHRIGGPAIVYPNGDEEWRVRGKLHREDGPAVTSVYSGLEWHLHGECHRTDGPAIEHILGGKEWWVGGREFTEDEFNLYVDQLTGEVLVPPGKTLRNDIFNRHIHLRD